MEPDKLKPSLEKVMEIPLPEHLRKAPENKQPRAQQKGRKPTPDALKRLLPDIEEMYLLWSPENKMVGVDFQGSLQPKEFYNIYFWCHVFFHGGATINLGTTINFFC